MLSLAFTEEEKNTYNLNIYFQVMIYNVLLKLFIGKYSCMMPSFSLNKSAWNLWPENLNFKTKKIQVWEAEVKNPDDI